MLIAYTIWVSAFCTLHSKVLKEIGFKKVFSLETSPKHGKHPREEWEEIEINLVNLAKDLATKAF